MTSDTKIALAHPGKIGDLFYAWPTMAALCKRHECTADLYTSAYCRPIIPLMEYQGAIDQVIIPPDYEITGYGQGVQPWRMPVHGVYDHVYQLGINKWPDNGLIEFYAKEQDIKAEPYEFACPDIDIGTTEKPLVVAICRRRGIELAQTTVDAFKGVIPVVQLRAPGEELLDGVINAESYDFLQTASVLKKARAYAGGTGANSVLAIAFYHTPSVIAYTQGIDDRHFVPAPQVTYMREPTFEEYLAEVKRKIGL